MTQCISHFWLRNAFFSQTQCHLLDLTLIKAETLQRVLLRHLSLHSHLIHAVYETKNSSHLVTKQFRVALYWLEICNFGSGCIH